MCGYVRALCLRVRRTRRTLPVYLFEACCDAESFLAKPVARSGGAAIRIVEPSGTSVLDAPGFREGRAVSWGVGMLQAIWRMVTVMPI